MAGLFTNLLPHDLSVRLHAGDNAITRTVSKGAEGLQCLTQLTRRALEPK